MLATDSPTIYEFIKPVIDYVNSLLTKLVPGAEVLILLLICFFIGYILKSKQNWGNGKLAVFTVMLFGSLRYLGI